MRGKQWTHSQKQGTKWVDRQDSKVEWGNDLKGEWVCQTSVGAENQNIIVLIVDKASNRIEH